MGHDIWIEKNQAAIMYVGNPPWHGLGTKLDRPATAEEAIKAAKLDWSVRMVPIWTGEGRSQYLVRNRYGIVPTDRWGHERCPVFGVVSRGYTPLQNREAFEFFDPLLPRRH